MIHTLAEGEVRGIVFTPNDAVRLALETIEQRRSYIGAGVRIGIRDVDEYLLPGRPGELITVMGMSSNYKSGLMQHWARFTASEIVRENVVNECVVYATWEQAIEEMLAFDLANTARLSATDVVQGKVSDCEMELLRTEVGARRVMTPIYLIGHSVKEQRKRPRLSMTAIEQALDFIKREYRVSPRIVFLDYLQQIDPEEGQDRRMQVFHNVHKCKDLGLSFGCPVVLGVQANRTVYREKWGIPGMADALETSNIEHSSDKMIGVWMPKTTYDVGKTLETKEHDLEVTERLLILKVIKQKLGPAGKWWPLYVEPERNRIESMAVSVEPIG